MRKKESFLTNRTKRRKFDAFNIICNMTAIGLLALFVIVTSKCISNMIHSNEPSEFVIPLLMRISAIILTILPHIFAYIFKINYPKIVQIMYYLFLFLSLFLGTFVGLYIKAPLYNRFVHIYGGALLGIISMFFVQKVSAGREKQLKPMIVFLLIFTFSMCFEACWEIWEFVGDSIFDLNMQTYAIGGVDLVGKKALQDTMLDICCNFVGAIICATICAICSYKFDNYIGYFKITKKEQKNEKIIEEIEE